jgi:hypothetical protein
VTALFFRLLFISVVLAAAVSSWAVSPEQQANYFAGVFMLESRKDLPDTIKVERYRELEALSGVTAAEARVILAKLRARPEEWRAMYERIQVLINESPTVPDKVRAKKDTLHSPVPKRR